MSKTKRVTLPRGEEVEIPTAHPDPSWFEHEKSGYVDPSMLAPYFNQPRRYIDPTKLDELKANIKHNGVRESLVVTPRSKAPWAEEGPAYEGTLWRIVSGHRRQRSSIEVGLEAVPVVVRLYPDEASFKADAEILNENREKLSEIEDGFILLDRLKRGEKITHIVNESGKSYQHLMGRIALTKLSPDIQARLSPELDRRQRLAIGLASALGDIKPISVENLLLELEKFGDNDTDPDLLTDDERRFCSQELHLDYIQKQGWKSIVAEKWLRTGEAPAKKLTNGSSPKVETHEKQLTARQRMMAWCKVVKEVDFMEMTPAELRKAFEYALPEDLEEMAEMLTLASQDIVGMAVLIKKIASEKPRTSKIVLELSKRSEQEITSD